MYMLIYNSILMYCPYISIIFCLMIHFKRVHCFFMKFYYEPMRLVLNAISNNSIKS